MRKVDDEDYILLLQENISEIGLIEPIVIDTKNVLLAGGHRLKACLNLGMKTIPCLRQPETTNDEDLKIDLQLCLFYKLAHNPLAYYLLQYYYIYHFPKLPYY